MSKSSHISTILTCIGAIGVVTTAVLTAKATPKALQLLERVEIESETPLTIGKKIRVAAPAYIPAAVSGVSTIACIFGANILNKRTQASMASAYALLDNSYREYRRKVNELYGEAADEEVVTELANDRYSEDDVEIPDGQALFFDSNGLRYFNAPMNEVIQKTKIEDGTEDGLECYIISIPDEW